MNLFDVYLLYNITPVKAEGVYVFDDENNRYLDLYGGHAVISIGHANSTFLTAVTRQLEKLGFYSNSIINPLQRQLADKLEKLSGCYDYQLFLCNSGAEANENALKLASFHTGKSRVLYFDKAFHGRTSAAVSVTDNDMIRASLNDQHNTTKIAFEDIVVLEEELQKGDVAAVIFEVIQGVGGLREATTSFYQEAAELVRKHGAVLIADEVQSGYGRTGDFFAFQKHMIRPDIISIAKGMGNGFPIGGILIDSAIEPKKGMLGTTFGGSHLSCAAGMAVLDVLEKEDLLQKAKSLFKYVEERIIDIPEVKCIKGRGLMLGLQFDFDIDELRKNLLFKYKIFTGASSNKAMLRILPPLIIERHHLETFFEALKSALQDLKK